MTDSRSRFITWMWQELGVMPAELPLQEDGNFSDDITRIKFGAWKAAESATARRCAEIARGVMHKNQSSDDNYGDEIDGKYMAAKEVAYAIKDEFPDAFK